MRQARSSGCSTDLGEVRDGKPDTQKCGEYVGSVVMVLEQLVHEYLGEDTSVGRTYGFACLKHGCQCSLLQADSDSEEELRRVQAPIRAEAARSPTWPPITSACSKKLPCPTSATPCPSVNKMPDPFFASNTRKRKRSTGASSSTSRKPGRSPTNRHASRGQHKSTAGPAPKKRRDEELSDETGEDNDVGGIDEMDLRAPDVVPDAYESGEDDEDETPAEKRLRLAKMYLDGVKQGLKQGAFHTSLKERSDDFHCLHSADGEFDAAEIDRELISARLKQDVLEHSGKVHLFVADSVRYHALLLVHVHDC